MKLKTARTDRPVPLQLIVKDARLIAESDPQVELAARIKKHLTDWREQSKTGYVERKLSDFQQNFGPRFPRMVMSATAMPPASPQFMATASVAPMSQVAAPASAIFARPSGPTGEMTTTKLSKTSPAPAKIRLSFPEVIFNEIVMVQGEKEVEVTLGDSITRYSIEAFALEPAARLSICSGPS